MSRRAIHRVLGRPVPALALASRCFPKAADVCHITVTACGRGRIVAEARAVL